MRTVILRLFTNIPRGFENNGSQLTSVGLTNTFQDEKYASAEARRGRVKKKLRLGEVDLDIYIRILLHFCTHFTARHCNHG